MQPLCTQNCDHFTMVFQTVCGAVTKAPKRRSSKVTAVLDGGISLSARWRGLPLQHCSAPRLSIRDVLLTSQRRSGLFSSCSDTLSQGQEQHPVPLYRHWNGTTVITSMETIRSLDLRVREKLNHG